MLILVTTLLLFSFINCQSITPVISEVYGNVDGSAKFEWTYNTDGTPRVDVGIQCGYISIPSTNFEIFLEKKAGEGSVQARGRGSSATIEQDRLGFSINNLQIKDGKTNCGNNNDCDNQDAVARKYYCILTVKNTNYDSRNAPVTLTVNVPPSLSDSDCRITTNEPRINEPLNINCMAKGQPVPELTCRLYDNYKYPMDAQESDNTGKLTTDLTNELPLRATYVICKAQGDVDKKQGDAELEIRIPDYEYEPFAVSSGTIKATDTTLELRWKALQNNESNPRITSYVVEYYVENLGTQNMTTTVIPIASNDLESDNGNLLYTIREGLASKMEYVVKVYGQNQLANPTERRNNDGKGEAYQFPMIMTELQRAAVETDTTAAIAGGVVGAIVLVAVIVALVVYMRGRKDKQTALPVSYNEEEVVDYPGRQTDSKPKNYQPNYNPPDVVKNGSGYNKSEYAESVSGFV